MPLMVTGGFRTGEGMEDALREGSVDAIGLDRPLITDPDVSRLLAGDKLTFASYERTLHWGPGPLSPTSPVFAFKAVNVLGQQGWFYQQLARRADGLELALGRGVLSAFVRYLADEHLTAQRMRRARRIRRAPEAAPVALADEAA